MVNYRSLPARLLLLIALIIAAAYFSAGKSQAASSQSFQILAGQAKLGMIMSLTQNPDVIEPADTTNSASMVGVVSPNQSNFDQASSADINVQTDGEANTLVSTLSGNLVVGDRVTSSAIEGVGAKLNTSGWVIGTAERSVDASTSGAVATSVTDNQGKKHTVYVALIPIDVHVTYYSSNSSSVAPQALQQLADNLAGKKVSIQIIVLSFFLFIIGVVSAGVIIVSAVRSGFLAIARQPLSKFVILREEWRSFATAVGILAFVMAACFLLLKFL
jgi:hypothetical protein